MHTVIKWQVGSDEGMQHYQTVRPPGPYPLAALLLHSFLLSGKGKQTNKTKTKVIGGAAKNEHPKRGQGSDSNPRQGPDWTQQVPRVHVVTEENVLFFLFLKCLFSIQSILCKPLNCFTGKKPQKTFSCTCPFLYL